MGKRILNRKELRAEYEAAERRRRAAEEDEDLDEDDEEEDEEEAEEDDDLSDTEDEEEEEESEEVEVKKRRRTATRSRRAARSGRIRVVWGVFDNSNKCVATFEYPKRKEAEEHAARLTAEKKSTHFVQPVKEPMPAKESP